MSTTNTQSLDLNKCTQGKNTKKGFITEVHKTLTCLFSKSNQLRLF